MPITIKIVKKSALGNNTIPSNGDIDPAPNSVVLDPNPKLDPANNNAPNVEQVQTQSETIQSDGADPLPANGLDGLPIVADEVVPDDAGLPIEKDGGQSGTTQPEDSNCEPTSELRELPGIVDEEPLEDDDDDDPRIDERREVELTEDFLADAFVGRFGRKIRFDHTSGRWYVWNDVYWEKDQTNFVFDMARWHCRELRGSDKRMASRRAVEGMEIMASRDRRVAVTSDIWDGDPFVLGTPDGYVNLLTGELMRPDPGLMVSRLTAVVPAEKGAPRPHFDSFLDQVTDGDAALRLFIQQYFGYTLTGITSEQVLLFIYGPGGNGKSQIQKVVAEILRDYAKTAAMDTFIASKHQRHLTEIAMLDGPRFVGMSETEKGQKWSQARINQLTGGDPVSANYMRQDHFTYVPKFKLMVVGNHKPQLGTVNDAARRRFLIVPFLFKPEKPDKTLSAKLREEYPAILRWMIEGCLDWQENGLVLPDVVKQATSDYFEDEDIFGRWIAEKCECGLGLKGKAAALYECWKEFAVANGEEPGSSKAFAEMLANRGFKKVKSDGIKYLGIAPLGLSTLNFGGEI
jgi:putative DNA primase/helicase